MRDMTKITLAVLGLTSVLSGCKTEESAKADPCGGDALQSLVGQPAESFDPDAWDRRVRVIPPDSAVTMDHVPQRLNVSLDEAGTIARIHCG